MNNKTTPRFTLVTGGWYAAELIGDEFADSPGLRSCSPIRVDRVQPKGDGRGHFSLSFYHANYPDGVRDKTYSLQMLERGDRFLLAKSTTHRPVRLLLVHDISWAWLYRELGIEQPPQEHDLTRWLSRNV